MTRTFDWRRAMGGALVAVCLLAVAGSIGRLVRPARADLPHKVGDRLYTPTFADWVCVWLQVSMPLSKPGGYIMAAGQITGRGERWTILCRYDPRTKSGRHVKDMWDLKLQSLRAKVRYWRARGYEIKMADFILDIKNRV